jgi:hypothetical protein
MRSAIRRWEPLARIRIPRSTSRRRRAKAVFVRACGQLPTADPANRTRVKKTLGRRFPQHSRRRARDPSTGSSGDGPTVLPLDSRTPRWQFEPCRPALARNTGSTGDPAQRQVVRRASSIQELAANGFASIGARTASAVPPAQTIWQALDVPQDRNISKTAPYFHNKNSAATTRTTCCSLRAALQVTRSDGPRRRPRHARGDLEGRRDATAVTALGARRSWHNSEALIRHPLCDTRR